MSTQWSNYLYVRFPALRKNKRTINFSRYAGIGDQRKPIGFSGDTYRLFDTLQYEVYMTPRAANIGFGWWSHDIGGFRVPKDETDAERYDNSNHTESPELFLRWLQFATFAPIFRTHCRYCEQRIWTWGDEWYPMMKETMMERHRLFPYINTHAHLETYAKGRSLLVPIYWSSTNAASMDEAYDPLFTNTEYLFGKHFLVAPITHSLKTTNTKKICR
jgi:alpha-glucosidase (family GH31 glycosyl hydrolase)